MYQPRTCLLVAARGHAHATTLRETYTTSATMARDDEAEGVGSCHGPRQEINANTLRAAPFVRVKVKFTVKNAVCFHQGLLAYGV